MSATTTRGRPRLQARSTVINLRLDEESEDALAYLCHRWQCGSTSEAVREALVRAATEARRREVQELKRRKHRRK